MCACRNDSKVLFSLAFILFHIHRDSLASHHISMGRFRW